MASIVIIIIIIVTDHSDDLFPILDHDIAVIIVI